MPPSAERIRVMTMNVYGPGNPDWERRHQLLGDTIRDLDPDIVALQEVPLDLDGDLGRVLGHGYHLAPFSESGTASEVRWRPGGHTVSSASWICGSHNEPRTPCRGARLCSSRRKLLWAP